MLGVPRAKIYIKCMLYLHLCTMMKLKMNFPKQTIRCLGYMSKMSLVFVNIGFSKKILEGKENQWRGPPPADCTCPRAILANSGLQAWRIFAS